MKLAFLSGTLCVAWNVAALAQSSGSNQPYWVPAQKKTTAAPAVTGTAQPPSSAPPVAPLPAPKPEASWPKVLPDTKGAQPAQQPQVWSPQEVEIAKARCNALLKGIDAVVIPVEPIKENSECGTPAPVQLVSIGKSPQVALSPPAIVTCDMVVGLDAWLKTDLQPLARKYLGSPIIKMEIMSSYSCRNAYGRTKTRLSEHGRANALDIRGFMTANAQPVDLLADWGPTQREIAAQVAAAKAAATKAEAERAAAIAASKQAPGTQPVVPQPATVAQPGQRPAIPGGTGTIIDGLPRVRVTIPGAAPSAAGANTGLGLTPPSRLGGPKPKTGHGAVAAAPPSHLPQAAQHVQDKKSLLLRQAHTGGCKIFGTVLGPEANNAHRNHFHVDMAERNSGAYCE